MICERCRQQLTLGTDWIGPEGHLVEIEWSYCGKCDELIVEHDEQSIIFSSEIEE